MAELDLTNPEARASYGIGMQMGQQLAEAFDGVELEAALAGARDVFNRQPPQVSREDLQAAFEIIQKQMAEIDARNAKQFAQAGIAFLEQNAKKAGIQITPSGLQYEIITLGTGQKPTLNCTVRTHYHGTLIDGTVFDSSYNRGEPIEFPVNGVIAGWTEALQLMPVGSKWKLYIPQELAYGERGAGRDIGPYQALIFDIELLDIV